MYYETNSFMQISRFSFETMSHWVDQAEVGPRTWRVSCFFITPGTRINYALQIWSFLKLGIIIIFEQMNIYLPIFISIALSGIKIKVLSVKQVNKNIKTNDPSLTFLNCMTKFMRLLVVFCACCVEPIEDCSKSSMEILFFSAWYKSFCRLVNWQYVRISI